MSTEPGEGGRSMLQDGSFTPGDWPLAQPPTSINSDVQPFVSKLASLPWVHVPISQSIRSSCLDLWAGVVTMCEQYDSRVFG
jgi:hypothetical protein